MSDQNKFDGQSSQLPGIAIVALVLGLFVFQDTAFKPSRPAMSDAEKTSTEDVRSRLWQDPFEAVALHRAKHQDSKNKEQEPVLPKAVDNNSYYTYQLDSNGFPRRICNTGSPFTAVHSIEELRCQIQRDTQFANNDEVGLHVLAVMIPGGPYAEDREWRLRSRYALISGLADVGYQPEDPEHISFIDFSQACKKTFSASASVISCDWPAYMPYEWFQLDNASEENIPSNDNQETLSKPNKILVLWLDNDAFARNNDPIRRLGRLKDAITPGEHERKFNKPAAIKPSFNVIGPHNSSTLMQMYDEVYDFIDDCNEKPEDIRCNKDRYYHLLDSLIFSPFATIDTDAIKKKIKNKFEREKFNEEYYSELEDRVFSTVSTNNELASTLLCELMLRGIERFNSTKMEPEFINDECKSSELPFKSISEKEKHHIVLIGESDTVYSRSLIESLKKKIQLFNTGTENIDEWVHIFKYLRGIDGINAEEATSTKNNPKEESTTHNQSKEKIEQQEQQLRRPAGSNQFDYLRRLAKHLEDLDKDKTNEGGIKAIGILGSDTYDKLLILQALHKKFPQTIFFTTDLDARLLHPAEKKWARNLIVASSYGLKLHEDIQGYTPPFRDTYQTALYLATKFAASCQFGKKVMINDSHCSDLNLEILLSDDRLKTSSRLFEVGNHGAVDLSHTSGNRLHPEPKIFSKEIYWDRIGSLVALLVCIALFLIYLAPSKTRKFIYVTTIGLFGVIILYVTLQSLDDPVAETFSFTNGTSTWPTNAIRFYAIIVAISFFILLIQQLKKSNKEITQKYINSSSQFKNEYIEKKAERDNFLSLLFIDLWGRSYQLKPLYFSMLWQRYRMMREFKFCGQRIFVMFVIYGLGVFFASHTGYFDSPIIPARGETSYRASNIIQFLSIFLYLILIFVIADITHLSNHFITLLKTHNVIWPEKLLCDYSYKYDISKDAANYKVHMDFVSQLGGAVNTFIYYPFLILFLMILSRSHYFDNWHYTPLLLAVISFTALLALSSAIRLTQGAHETRVYILEKLDNIYWQGQQNSPSIKLLSDEIRNLQTGPFLPLSRHPVVFSILIPFGGVGSLYLIEYLTSIIS